MLHFIVKCEAYLLLALRRRRMLLYSVALVSLWLLGTWDKSESAFETPT